MGTYTQENRLIKLTTPLGQDVLLLQAFNGQESVSRLFHFDLMMHSENRSLSFEGIVGKKATIHIMLPGGSERYINGIISSFSQGGSSHTFAHYHATLVPWLWMLTRTSDCRIFQKKTVPDIIQQIFGEYGFSDFENRLHGHFEKREYCVQYRETDFNFVSRLMEEEGIFYFFTHQKEKHVLVLANNKDEFKPSPYQPEARYELSSGAGHLEEVVTEWSKAQEVRPGKYEVKDYNFEQPSLDLTANVTGKDKHKYEIYDYPGEYMSKGSGEQLVGIRMEEEDAAQVVIKGSSRCRGFSTGYRFDLKEHYRRDFNKSYVLLSVYHSANQGDNYQSSNGDGAQGFDYVNHFQCIPYPTSYRPARVTPVPLVHGTQTAVVVGPKGEEIYTDKYGRVKVQFHWDREGKRDEQSSCWIRVSQPWAGKGWGAVSIPRIGQEVVVDFLEGDPDQPIIVGRVYNAEQMPPYTLPANMTQSGIKSRSSKSGGGANFNEIRMEDKKGSEELYIHAEKDENIMVEHDKSETVGHDETIHIVNDRKENVDGNETLTVTKNRTRTVSKNEIVTVALTRTHSVGVNEAITVGGAQEVTVGAARAVTVGAAQAVSIGANLTENIGRNHSATVANNRSASVGKDDSLQVGKNLTINAGDQITLTTGKASISMKKDGTIVIQGKDITIKGSGKITAKADSDMILKGSKIAEN